MYPGSFYAQYSPASRFSSNVPELAAQDALPQVISSLEKYIASYIVYRL